MKKGLLLFLILLITFVNNTTSINAQEVMKYTIEDEGGAVVETGFIGLAKVTYLNLSLTSNHTLSFTPSANDLGYFVRSGNTMYTSYKLNKSVDTVLSIKKSGYTVFSDDFSSSSVSSSYKSESNDYYEVRIKNSGSTTIMIESITITY